MRGSDIDSEKTVGVVAMLVLGAGFLALFLGVQSFWMVWVLGYAVVVPIVAILLADEDADTPDDGGRDTDDDALATLRERYARGELTDEQFERKVDRLLRTETVEVAADQRLGDGDVADERTSLRE